jgi:cytochrome P450
MLTYELGRNTLCQSRLRQEVMNTPVDVSTYGAVDELPLLDQAFKEILRMYAPAGALFRQAIKDTEILGHFVPRKSQIALSVHASMRLPDYWPDPDTFDPSRFENPANRDAVHRYAFSPFGGGVHKCIGQYFAGMTVKTILHGLLRRFEWTVPDGYRVPLTWGTGPMPDDKMPITMERVQPAFT